MSVTPQLRAMLAEKAKREAEDVVRKAAEQSVAERDKATKAIIDAAAPFLDAGPRDERKWSPSALVRIGFCVIGTSSSPARQLRAERFVAAHLARARNLYRAGFYANPFADVPALRDERSTR